MLIARNDYCCGLKDRLQKKCWNHPLNKEITQRAYFYFSVKSHKWFVFFVFLFVCVCVRVCGGVPNEQEATSCRSTVCFIGNLIKGRGHPFPTQSEETKHTFLFSFFFFLELPSLQCPGGKTEARLMQLFQRLFAHTGGQC